MLRSLRFLFLFLCLLGLSSGCLPIQPVAAVPVPVAKASAPTPPYFLRTACLYRIPPGAIPTLLLTGAYDCALPPYLSQPLATTLSHSYHYVLPVGHAVVGSLCGLYLTDQFWANPTVQPDAACITQMGVEWSTR